MKLLSGGWLLALTPALLLAREPGALLSRPAKFSLFARALMAFEVNRVSCGLHNEGEICLDPSNSTVIGGAFWPKGTPNLYIFNSGPQIAGIIGANGGAWAGDTAGAFFFDDKGTTIHGVGVTEIFDASDSTEVAAWPAAALVPAGTQGSLFHPGLHSRVSASEGDAWWLMGEGDTTRLSGRRHPLGVLAETRVLGWNYPSGNEDILYVAVTYYNITSLNPADYTGVRAELRPYLLDYAARFHAQNNARFQIALPTGGYTIDSLFLGFKADFDVGDAGQNYASVNIPLSLSYAYDHSFSALPWWQFDPTIFSSPFYTGTGLGGIRFLDAEAAEGETRLYSNTTGGGADLGSARDVSQLYRYLSGTMSPAAGDGACNFNPLTQHICIIRNTSPSDIRAFHSTGPFTLKPGEFQNQLAAYIFAAPVQTGGITLCPSCDIKPGNSAIIAGLSNPAVVAGGVNPIDSIAGFLGAPDLSGDGILQDDEFLSLPRSLYGKAQLAQAIFDHQFLLPSGPAAPDFFLIPGDGQVTVLWRPSASEQTGDAYFAIAKDAQVLNDQGVLVPNPLYDPNFRQFDVEGYRIYRARVDDPAAMTLLMQFDYAGTVISDYAAQVNGNRFCAPELGVTQQCAVTYDPITPGQPRSAHLDVPLVGTIEQVRMGDRILLPDGTALPLRTDSVFTGSLTALVDNGVPFSFVDNTVRNNFRYYYTVTTFDVNSWQSGPSSFESPRVLKSVTPVRPASNHENSAETPMVELFGRGVRLDPALPLPTIDPVTGRFSGPFPPASPTEYPGPWLSLTTFLANTLAGPGSLSAVLDSVVLGSPYSSVPHIYWWTATSTTSDQRTSFAVPILQPQEIGVRSGQQAFSALEIDPGIASRFGGGSGYTLQGQLLLSLPGPDYMGIYGRGCVNFRPGFGDAGGGACAYNGSRWFDGPSPLTNETQADPIAGNTANSGNIPMTNYNNAGRLTGVTTIFQAQSYQSAQNFYRQMEGALAGARRAADFNVYWGAGGQIDSVIDVTYNVAVPFNATVAAGTWGILNQASAQPSGVDVSYDQRAELTVTDMSCVEPFRSLDGAGPQGVMPCGTTSPGDGPQYLLSQTAVPGPIAFFSPSTVNARTSPVAANNGFVLYLSGSLFTFELAGGQLPPAGRVWALRTYVGAISGGNGDAGNFGPYLFSHPEGVLPVTAVGVELRLSYDVVNRVNAPTNRDLSAVHPVPDPYYLANAFEADAAGQVIKFVNLPQDAVIRIYSSSGVLVTLLEHHSTTFGGATDWDVRNRTGRRVSSGVYFYHIEAGNARRVGRLTIVNDRPGF